jgi:hypothetical protein
MAHLCVIKLYKECTLNVYKNYTLLDLSVFKKTKLVGVTVISWSRVHTEMIILAKLVKNCPSFMEICLHWSLSCIKQIQSRYIEIYLIHFNIILLSMLVSQMVSYQSKMHSSMHLLCATCPTHLTRFYDPNIEQLLILQSFGKKTNTTSLDMCICKNLV